MTWKENLERKNESSGRVYVLYGNVYDLFVCNREMGFLPFWMNKTICKDSFVVYYDISSGISFNSEDQKAKFYKWLEIYDDQSHTSFSTSGPIKDINSVLTLMNRFSKQERVDLIVKYSETLFPNCDMASPSMEEKVGIIKLLNEIGNNMFSEKKLRVFLLSESLSELNSDLINSDYVNRIQVDFPNADERKEFILTLKLNIDLMSEMSLEELVKKTAGLNLIKIYNLFDNVTPSGEKITYDVIAKEKKRIIEEFCSGLVRFIEPKPGMNLDRVANHKQAKKCFRDIVWLIKNGKEKVVEKGILIPGRVGVGKSFLVHCFASECGLPVMELAEFRSKWVGDTEKQLARILMIIKVLGPVIVVVDEADAVLGNREQSGDSGVSSRTFSTLAAHIGDASIRGKEIWIAMTSRPDLLPIDMKRQGRFGLCIPLFPALTQDDTYELFEIVAKMRGINLPLDFKGYISQSFAPGVFSGLTGSEVESIIIRAEEKAIFNQREDSITVEDFREAVDSFIDPLDRLLIKLQTYAAILSCSDRRFLPTPYCQMSREEIEKEIRSQY